MRVQVAALADIIRSKEAADRDKDRAALGTLRPGAGAPRRLRRPTDGLLTRGAPMLVRGEFS